MASRRLKEINAAALKPVDGAQQPKAMGLFKKTALEQVPNSEGEVSELSPEPEPETKPLPHSKKSTPLQDDALHQAASMEDLEPTVPVTADLPVVRGTSDIKTTCEAELGERKPSPHVDAPSVSFMAKVSEASYAALEDAVIYVRRQGGIRKFSRADVAEAMFLLFAEIASDIDLSQLPTKVQHQGLAFRQALKDLVWKTLRDKRAP